ncbi:MAG: phosphate acyltransferase PlsX [Caulobacterales bacterium]|nr:phosphate acyltransferase PlsX [Caulobacterales bacterium]
MTTQTVTISVDAMGGDHAPATVVEGVHIAARETTGEVRFLLHGDAARLGEQLTVWPKAAGVCEIRHTDTLVTMDAKPSQALRRSKGSSMWNAVEAVKNAEAAVAVSAGNTGALMAIAKIVLRPMANVHRPAIAASWPTPEGACVVLDVGANVECGAPQLAEFAIMGEAYHRAIYGAARPTVGLLNVGAEELKGNKVVRDAAQLLRAADLDLNYLGFVEGDDISMGAVDVVVTDGFTGNVALKTAEGTARLVAGFVREALAEGVRGRLSAIINARALKDMKDRMDPRNVNGGVFLGLNGVVVKSHGGADGRSFATALKVAIEMARSEFGAEVARNLERFAALRPRPAADADSVAEASS